MKELVRLLRHLIDCSQSVDYEMSPLNFLFICIPEWLYRYYTDEPYIARPGSPGIIPIYNPADSAAQHANTKAQWEINEKMYRDPITMDSALIARFASLIEPAWQTEFSKKRISEPNMTFLACFKWFFL